MSRAVLVVGIAAAATAAYGWPAGALTALAGLAGSGRAL